MDRQSVLQQTCNRLAARSVSVDTFDNKTEQFHWTTACSFKITVPAVIIPPPALSGYCGVVYPLVTHYFRHVF